LGCGLDPECPFGQVKLCVDIVFGTQGPDLDAGIQMVSHEHPPYGSLLRRSPRLTAAALQASV
jgi:hypothetical protein